MNKKIFNVILFLLWTLFFYIGCGPESDQQKQRETSDSKKNKEVVKRLDQDFIRYSAPFKPKQEQELKYEPLVPNPYSEPTFTPMPRYEPWSKPQPNMDLPLKSPKTLDSQNNNNPKESIESLVNKVRDYNSLPMVDFSSWSSGSEGPTIVKTKYPLPGINDKNPIALSVKALMVAMLPGQVQGYHHRGTCKVFIHLIESDKGSILFKGDINQAQVNGACNNLLEVNNLLFKSLNNFTVALRGKTGEFEDTKKIPKISEVIKTLLDTNEIYFLSKKEKFLVLIMRDSRFSNQYY